MEDKKIFPFKNPNWPERKKQLKQNRGHRHNKNWKQIATNEALSGRAYNYQSIQAPPSTIPAKKYCDITGYESKYLDSNSGLIFFDRTISSYIKMLNRPTIEQFLAIRKPISQNEKVV